MKFEIVGKIESQETFITGNAIREIARLRRVNGSTRRAEIHWYEATGIGKKEFKIKYLLD